MKKKIAITAALVAALSSTAFAQTARDRTDPFAGFSMGLILNSSNSTTEVTSNTLNVSDQRTSTNFSLQGQYNWKFGSNIYLAAGASLGLTSATVATVSNQDYRGKNMASVFVAPGVAVADGSLLYGKLASNHIRLENDNGGGSDFDGYGYGIGLQQHVGNGLSVQVEYMANQYSDKTYPANAETDRFKANVLSVGLNYRF